MPVPLRSRARLAAVAVSAFLLLPAACRNPFATQDVSGIYALHQYDGRDAAAYGLAGAVRLYANGTVQRRFRVGEVIEYKAVGTFKLTETRLDLRLRDEGGRSDHEWRPPATLVRGVLTLRYPHPADGPDIVEIYHRQ